MLLLYLALPFACIWAAPRSERDAVASQIVFGLALYETILLATGLLLGHVGALRPHPYAGAHALFLAVLAGTAWYRRSGPPLFACFERALRWARTRRGAMAVALVVGVAVLFGIQLAADAALGTRQWDALGYHIPRSMMWASQGSLAVFPTPSWHQLGLPVGANLVLGSKIFLGLGWAGAAWVNALLTTGAVIAVFLAARDLGLSRWRAVLAAVLFASFPAIGERVSSVSSDMAATFPVLAGYVAWTRARDATKGLAAFVLLAGVGVACKSTVAPFVVLLGTVAAHRTWKAGRRWSPSPSVALAAATALAVVAASFWPVYAAFGDLVGGPAGASHAVHDMASFVRSVLVNGLNWALEPLGYVPHTFRGWMPDVVRSVYGSLGVRFEADQLPATVVDWAPWPSPDSGRTGALSIVAFAAVIPLLPAVVRRRGLPLFALAFVIVSGMFCYQPYSGRFTITLLAAYALLWTAPTVFARPAGRRWLAVIAAGNLAAALAVTSYLTWRDFRLSRDGQTFDLLHRSERLAIATALNGTPISMLSAGSLDALVPGPEVALEFRYLVCPRDGDWARALSRLSPPAAGVALVHVGSDLLDPAPASPPDPPCPKLQIADARAALDAAGYTRQLATPNLDVWLRARGSEAGESGSGSSTTRW